MKIIEGSCHLFSSLYRNGKPTSLCGASATLLVQDATRVDCKECLTKRHSDLLVEAETVSRRLKEMK